MSSHGQLKIPTACIVGVLVCLLAAGTVFADIVTLKNGRTFAGKIVSEDDKTVTLKLSFGKLVINRDEIRTIKKEEPSTVLVKEADGLLKRGKMDEAIAKYEAALAINPRVFIRREKLIRAYRLKASSLREKGRQLAVDAVCRRILELSPNDDEALRRIARADRIRANAPAAEKEAQLLVSLERYRAGIEVFDRIKAYLPGARMRNKLLIAEAHAGYGRRLMKLKRFVEARSHYLKAVELNPKLLSKYRHEVVISRFATITDEINRDGKSIPPARWLTLASELKTILAHDEANPHFHFALAACYHELGRLKDATREYCKVTGEKPDYSKLPGSIDALHLRARDEARKKPIMLIFPRGRFKTIRRGKPQVLETKHFIIHHHNDELALLVARGAEYYLERNYRVFLDKMPENPWSKKCHINIHRSKEEYVKGSSQADWSPAMARTSSRDRKLSTHSIHTYQDVENLLPSHLSHELTHIIHGAVINYSGFLPTWLREGIAVRQEPWFKRIHMAKVIKRESESGELPTLDDVVNQKGYPDADKVDLFYAQSYVLVEALERAGTREQFTRLCRSPRGTHALAAIKAIYGLDREELTVLWKKHEKNLISLCSIL